MKVTKGLVQEGEEDGPGSVSVRSTGETGRWTGPGHEMVSGCGVGLEHEDGRERGRVQMTGSAFICTEYFFNRPQSCLEPQKVQTAGRICLVSMSQSDR